MLIINFKVVFFVSYHGTSQYYQEMKYILFLVCFFFANMSFAGTLSVSDKDFADTIPIEFKAGKILVPVTVQGRERNKILFIAGYDISV